MADKKVNIEVGVKGVEEAKSKLGSLGSFVKSHFVITLGDVTRIAKTVFAAFQDVSKAAAESEQANKKLAFALKQNGDGSEFASNEIQAFNAELQKNIGISDEVIATSQAMFVAITGLSGDALKQATLAAADLSAKTGDMESAFDMITKAVNGNVVGFQRMGITIKEGATQAENFKNVMRAVSENFGGSALNNANTYAGSIAKLGTSFDELKERIGKVTNEGLAPLASAMTSFLNQVNELIDINTGQYLKEMGLSEKTIETYQKLKKLEQERLLISKAFFKEKERENLDRQIEQAKKLYKTQQAADLDAYQNEQKKQAQKEKTSKQLEDEKALREKMLKENQKNAEDAAKKEDEIEKAKQESQESSYFAQLGLTKEKNDLIEKSNLAQMQSAEDLGRFILDSVKRRIIGEITLEEQAAIAKASIALATAIATLNFAGMAAAASQLAVPTAIAATKIAAVNAVKFAQGGNFETSGAQSYTTIGGQGAVVGEAGKERITVEPIGKSSNMGNGGSLVVQINLDGKTLARQLYPHIQAIDRRVI
jgi:hypothetical protein